MSIDPRKFLNADGTYKRVDIRDLATLGRWGVQLLSTSEHSITIGQKVWTVDQAIAGRVRLGDEVQATAIQNTECSMWGLVIEIDEASNELTAVFGADDLSPITGGPFSEWELQITNRSRAAIERAYSASTIDPTDPTPLVFTVPAGKYFPLSGSVIATALADPTQIILGRVRAYGGTDLYLSKLDTTATVSADFSAWRIELIDGPIEALPLKGINGLVVRRSDDHEIEILPGSVMDSTGTILLTLDAALTKDMEAAWAAGAGNGGMMRTAALAGTISSAALAVTGTGTAFLTDFFPDTILPDYIDNGGYYTASTLANAIISTADNIASPAGAVTTNTAMDTETALAASGDAYYRGLTSVLHLDAGRQVVLFTVLVRDDDTGEIDAILCCSTASGEPDLPAGYTFYRVIAAIAFTRNATPSLSDFEIDMHLYYNQTPFAAKELPYLLDYSYRPTDYPNAVSIPGLSAKTVAVDADELIIRDSEDANALKRLTLANLKTYLGL
jgi:hypothetical protein